MKNIIKQMEPMNVMLHSLREALYMAIINAIIQLIRPFMETNPNGIEYKFCYRYIDDDLYYSIRRIKRIWLESNQLWILYDSDNGESEASEVYSDDDDNFEDENTMCLSIHRTTTFDIDFAQAIYDWLHDIIIPRILENKKD